MANSDALKINKKKSNDRASGLPLSYYQKKWDDHLTGKNRIQDKEYLKNLREILKDPGRFGVKDA